MPLQFWCDLAFVVVLLAALLLSHKYPPARWVRMIVRDELAAIESERAEAQRKSIDADIASMKERK